MFNVPVKFAPIKIKIDCEQNHQELDPDSVNIQLANNVRYSHEHDIVELSLGNIDQKLFFDCYNTKSSRMIVKLINELDNDATDAIVSNTTFHQNLEYLHLLLTVNGCYFVSELVQSAKVFKQLKHLV